MNACEVVTLHDGVSFKHYVIRHQVENRHVRIILSKI